MATGWLWGKLLLNILESLTSVSIPVSSRAATTYAVSEIFPWMPPYGSNQVSFSKNPIPQKEKVSNEENATFSFFKNLIHWHWH